MKIADSLKKAIVQIQSKFAELFLFYLNSPLKVKQQTRGFTPRHSQKKYILSYLELRNAFIVFSLNFRAKI
ncbi:MAG: hypothetical protein A2626_00565 [Candidatus Nealsonbacteria bacterium RIFCSPHIGHO2_01_FULL_38_55]|uniref:Uncharacterized protein n=2 Tax=Candidatus Nealsoniibacteriota TaxID=1817911 RepID=A0A1G2EH72_9BACT|nr:MAG: hypothetical protein A2626_00565 [Candidatus Nealsonbacteria bacterium RIFCSPHIGHO2_01_FULL_38_55]OGZ25126.1 MAG: hypothetical protein A2W71_01975 [Candidatus Nealsonbacteria bacterium RIFCSPLOWO2_02_39_8]OGZ25630.1 MAG: hypothetical protein A3I85_00765 [Candidatus Nealsonbacteria bacterium RIFCSPLOWO2_02_FULL_38_63]